VSERALQIGAYAGRRSPERPLWVEIDGARAEVAEVEREWREPDRLGFQVVLGDGKRMVLYYVLNDDRWLGAERP